MANALNPLVLGLDIGTTSTDGILVELPDGIVSVATRPTTLSSPHPGWAEEDPLEWWANACAVLCELMGAADRRALAGICVTGMVPAVVLLDSEDEPLRPSIQQSDGRSAKEVAELAAELDEPLFLAKTGNGVNQQLLAAKTRWLERHDWAVFAKIATVLGSYDYINWRLTGVRGVERNWALEAGLIDLAKDAVDDDLIALTHVRRSAIPPVMPRTRRSEQSHAGRPKRRDCRRACPSSAALPITSRRRWPPGLSSPVTCC